MLEKLRELYSYKDFFFQLLFLQMHSRYQGSFLGFLWTLLNPLLTFASFSLVFSFLNNWNLRDYGIYFFSGFIVWNFFSNACLLAADSIVGNPVFVTKVYSPRALFPLSIVAMQLVDLGAGLVLLFALKLILGSPITLSVLFLPVSLFLVIAFTIGAALLCAQLNVFFRDFRYLLNTFFFIWFFFSPVVWKADAMPEQARIYIRLNPAAHFLSLFQNPLWANMPPPETSISLTAVTSLIVLAAGWLTFIRSERRFYYYL